MAGFCRTAATGSGSGSACRLCSALCWVVCLFGREQKKMQAANTHCLRVLQHKRPVLVCGGQLAAFASTLFFREDMLSSKIAALNSSATELHSVKSTEISSALCIDVERLPLHGLEFSTTSGMASVCVCFLLL